MGRAFMCYYLKDRRTCFGFHRCFDDCHGEATEAVAEARQPSDASADPEPFAENSHVAGRPETITSDDRNGFSMRDPLVLEGQG